MRFVPVHSTIAMLHALRWLSSPYSRLHGYPQIFPNCLYSSFFDKPFWKAMHSCGNDLCISLLLTTSHTLHLPPPSSLANSSNHTTQLTTNENIQCHHLATPPMPGLNPTNCECVADNVCHSLVNRKVPLNERDEWSWLELSGCAIGFYLRTNVL